MIFFILFAKSINFSFNNLLFVLNLGMKSNILIVGLIDEFNKNIAYEVSNRLGVYFLDIKDLIEYEITDRQNMIDLCGIEYLEKQEYKIINSVTGFENTIITISNEIFTKWDAYNIFNDSCIILYLRLSENEINEYFTANGNKFNLNQIVFKDRDDYLTSNSKITINVKINSPEKAIKDIIKQIERINL